MQHNATVSQRNTRLAMDIILTKRLKDSARRVDAVEVERLLVYAYEEGYTEVAALLDRVLDQGERWNSRCGTVHINLQVSIHFNGQ